MKLKTNQKLYSKKNFSFNFRLNYQNNKLNLELPFTEHIQELRQRTLHFFLFFIIIFLSAFLNIKIIVELLEIPVSNIRFFQLSPGEYFIETVKIAIYSGLILTSPIFLSQITFFIIPGLTQSEKKLILPLLVGSTLLFFLSLLFSYFCLIPAALQFFVSYSSEVIEPLLSFSQYCDFILVLFSTTGIAFQIPIFQIILGIFGILSGTTMLKLWKYVVLFAVIFGAILTPSTDPITQILLSSAIILLYLIGAGILVTFKR